LLEQSEFTLLYIQRHHHYSCFLTQVLK